MNCLSPSILSADFSRLGEQIKELDEAGAERHSSPKNLRLMIKSLRIKSHFWLQRKHSTEMSQTRSKRKKTESMKKKKK